MRRRSPREQLAIAKGQLRAVSKVLAALPTSSRSPRVVVAQPEPSGRFIQCWAVYRRGASITQALDDYGQVWELRTDLAPKVEGQKGAREVLSSWWEKITMDKRS